jgi:hypothetical protein
MFEGFTFTCDKLKKIRYNEICRLIIVNSNLFILLANPPEIDIGRIFFALVLCFILGLQMGLIDVSPGDSPIHRHRLHCFLRFEIK